MDEKHLQAHREGRERDSVTEERQGRMYRRRDSRCDGRIWIFLILGFMMVVFGVVIGGMYLNIRALTESLQYTEVLPTYLTAVAVLTSGLFIFLLFWKRIPCLVFTCVLACVTTALLCAIAAILTGTHVIQPIEAFIHCTYYDSLKECHCVSPYRREVLDLHHSALNPTNYVFRDSSNCSSIQATLLHMLYALTVMYSAAFLTSVLSAILALLVLRMERLRRGMFEDDTYEEIFTVSNSSTPLTSDSDNDNNNFCLPPYSDAILPDISRTGAPETRTNAGVIRRCRSFTQPRFFDAAVEQSINDANLPKPETEEELDKGAGNQNGGGRLKENRRRHRRAVTLHNLDTRQLMMILSLHMRYLEENEAATKSQGQINIEKGGGGGEEEGVEGKARTKRTQTPQPHHPQHHQYRRYFSQDDSSAGQTRAARSHTPQPHHERRRSQSQEETFSPSPYVIRSHTPQPYNLRSNPNNKNNRQGGEEQNYENTFDPSEFVQQMRERTTAGVQRQQREVTPSREATPSSAGQIYENLMDTTDVSSLCGSESSDSPVRQVSVKARQKTRKPSHLNQGVACVSGYRVKTSPPRDVTPPPREITPNNYDEIDDISSCVSETSNQQIYENQDECEQQQQLASKDQPTSSQPKNPPMKSFLPSHRPIKKVEPPTVPSPQPAGETNAFSVLPHNPMNDAVTTCRSPVTLLDTPSSVSNQPISEADPRTPPPRKTKKEVKKGRTKRATNSSEDKSRLSSRLKTASDHLHPIQTNIPGHLLDRCPTPSRPKSYINAVEQALSTRADDCAPGSSDNVSPDCVLHYCNEDESTETQPRPSEGYLRMDMKNARQDPDDIYAQPKKKHGSRNAQKSHVQDPYGQQTGSVAETDEVSQAAKHRERKRTSQFSGERSAFHAVSKHYNFEPISDPYSVDQPIRLHQTPDHVATDIHGNAVYPFILDQPMPSKHLSNQPIEIPHSSSQPIGLLHSSHQPMKSSRSSHLPMESAQTPGHAYPTRCDISYHPAFEKKSPQAGYAPPPYSPPPSYTDVFAHSRDSSQQSLLSTSAGNSVCEEFLPHDRKAAVAKGPLAEEQFYENNPHVARLVHATCAEHSGAFADKGRGKGSLNQQQQQEFHLQSGGAQCYGGRHWGRCDSGDRQFEECLSRGYVDAAARGECQQLRGRRDETLYAEQTSCADDSDVDAMETVI